MTDLAHQLTPRTAFGSIEHARPELGYFAARLGSVDNWMRSGCIFYEWDQYTPQILGIKILRKN